MKTFDEMLAAVAAAPRKTAVVSVIFDEDLASEKATLESQLKTADTDQRLGVLSAAKEIEQRLIQIEDEAKDQRVFLQLTRLPTRAWMELTSLHPVRLESEIDRYYGFNWDDVCVAAVRFRDPVTGQAYGHRLDGETPVDLTPENWDVFFDRLPGGEGTAVRDAVWNLNSYGPQEKREALVKTFGVTPRSDTI